MPLWALVDSRPSNVDKKSTPGQARVRLVNYVDVYYNRDITPDLELMEATASEDHLARFRVQQGDVIVTKDSETPDDIGIAAMVTSADHDMVCGYHLSLLRPRLGRVHPRFLYWFLESKPAKDYWLISSFGVTRYSLQTGALSRLAVPDPDLPAQRAIAAYLDREVGKVDALIGKLVDLADGLQQRAARMRTTLVLGLTRQSQHHAEDVNTPISGTPEFWEKTKFGYDFSESTERNGQHPPGPLLSISEYRGVELNTRLGGQQASLDVSKYRVVRPGQLAANMMWLNHGGLGVSSLTGHISPDYKAFWISKRFEPRYVHHLFRSSRYIDYFAAIANGVRPNAQRVTKTLLDATPVPLPPIDEQIRIADQLDEAASRDDSMLVKVAKLKERLIERRTALITDVVTGRSKVV